MQSFIRGQRAKLAQLSDRTRRFGVKIALQSARVPVFDFVCFGVDERGQLSDDRFMVFFNQKRAPQDAIVLEELSAQSAHFIFDLDLVPPSIARLVFTVSVDSAGTMKELSASSLQLWEDGLLYPQTLAEYGFSGADFGVESALMLAEIYRKDGEWRFWAQGQGFAGNLAALLKHFGGEEIEASAQPAPPTIIPQIAPVAPPLPIRQPSPPVFSPAPSVTVVAPAVRGQNALQKAIDAAPAGGTLQLARGEWQGPILIDKPLILEGNGAVIWAQNGPVVRVSSAGVTLRHLEIEATAPDAGPHSGVALWVDEGVGTLLQQVRARGEIVGVAGMRGNWKLPPVLDLGEFAARETNSFGFEIEVPQPCDLKIDIAGLSVVPPRVEAGRVQLEVRAGGIGNDTFLTGHLELSSGGIGRTVPLHGRAVEGAPPARGVWLWPLVGAR